MRCDETGVNERFWVVTIVKPSVVVYNNCPRMGTGQNQESGQGQGQEHPQPHAAGEGLIRSGHTLILPHGATIRSHLFPVWRKDLVSLAFRSG